MSPTSAARAANIKLLVLDVDGVLTDGRVIYDEEGREIKFFDVRDGHGIKLLQRTGVKIAWLSGRESNANRVRARELGIDLVKENFKIKLPALQEMLGYFHVNASEVAFMGDDLIDLPPMRYVGLAMCPSDAMSEVRHEADWIADYKGGRGAVRQACEFIMKSQNTWEEVTSRYFD